MRGEPVAGSAVGALEHLREALPFAWPPAGSDQGEGTPLPRLGADPCTTVVALVHRVWGILVLRSRCRRIRTGSSVSITTPFPDFLADLTALRGFATPGEPPPPTEGPLPDGQNPLHRALDASRAEGYDEALHREKWLELEACEAMALAVALAGPEGAALAEAYNVSVTRCGHDPFPSALGSGIAAAARSLLDGDHRDVRASRVGARLLRLLRDERHGAPRIVRARMLSWLRFEWLPDRAACGGAAAGWRAAFDLWVERHDAVRHWLWASNLRLAVWGLQRSGLPRVVRGELLVAACEGLDRAVDSYEPVRGASLSTYAFNWVRVAAQREAWTTRRPLRVTNHVREGWWRLWRAEVAFRLREGCVPALEELAEEAEVELAVVKGWLAARRSGPPASLILGSDGSTILDWVPSSQLPTPAEQAWQIEAERQIARSVEDLLPRTQFVLRRRYGLDGSEPATLSEVGRELDLSRERVRQIEREGLHQIRAVLRRLAEEWCEAYGLVPAPMTPPTS